MHNSWKWGYLKQSVSWGITQTNIRKFQKRNVHSTFIDNIWGADLTEMQLVSKFIKGFIFFYVFSDFSDVFSKYVWVISISLWY